MYMALPINKRSGVGGRHSEIKKEHFFSYILEVICTFVNMIKFRSIFNRIKIKMI